MSIQKSIIHQQAPRHYVFCLSERSSREAANSMSPKYDGVALIADLKLFAQVVGQELARRTRVGRIQIDRCIYGPWTLDYRLANLHIPPGLFKAVAAHDTGQLFAAQAEVRVIWEVEQVEDHVDIDVPAIRDLIEVPTLPKMAAPNRCDHADIRVIAPSGPFIVNTKVLLDFLNETAPWSQRPGGWSVSTRS